MKHDTLIQAMNDSIAKANETMLKNLGGPFGAAVVNQETGEIISVSSNSVLSTKDPTAHAEVNAIREACKKLDTFDLSGHVVVTTCYPCPMCLGAMVWANISKFYYGSTAQDAAEIGFRDEAIYEYLRGENKSLIWAEQIVRDKTIKLFLDYSKLSKEIY